MSRFKNNAKAAAEETDPLVLEVKAIELMNAWDDDARVDWDDNAVLRAIVRNPHTPLDTLREILRKRPMGTIALAAEDNPNFAALLLVCDA